jgi:hypothetical protein
LLNRNTTDRRRSTANPRFPMRDPSNTLVRHDRRTRPDRRLSGIEVEWLEIVQDRGIYKSY